MIVEETPGNEDTIRVWRRSTESKRDRKVKRKKKRGKWRDLNTETGRKRARAKCRQEPMFPRVHHVSTFPLQS